MAGFLRTTQCKRSRAVAPLACGIFCFVTLFAEQKDVPIVPAVATAKRRLHSTLDDINFAILVD
jgi:hypothetical protein